MISPAFAQAAGGSPMTELLGSPFIPLLAMLGIFYFIWLRPQQKAHEKKVKEHQDRINAVRRGDVVVTSGGIIGKVVRVGNDNEVRVEIADGVQVRVLKGTLTEVRGKTEPVREKRAAEPEADNDDTPAQPTV